MPKLNELIERIQYRGEQAAAEFDALAVAAVEGKKIDDAKVEKVCIAAGKSLAEFAERLAVLEQRREAWESYHGTDWEAERETLAAQSREAETQHQALTAEVEALRSELKAIGEARTLAANRLNEMTTRKEKARRHATDSLRATGKDDDWRSVGEPTRRDVLPKVNVGSGPSGGTYRA